MRILFRIDNNRLAATDDESAPVWFYTAPTADEISYLTRTLHIDEHTLASALDPDELSRVEFEPGHVAFIFKRPKNYSRAAQFELKVASTGVFAFPHRVIIVSADDYSLLEGAPIPENASPVMIALRLISASVNHFLQHLKIMNTISDELQDKINRSMENRYLLHLFSLQKSLVYYVSSIHTNGILLEKVRNTAEKLALGQVGTEYVDDLIIDNMQCLKQAEIDSNILASLMDARVSIVSNNLNVLMKTLNIITIAIMVPTFVVSAFSMNVKIPIQDRPGAFYIIIGLAALSVAFLMLVWKWKSVDRWTGKRLHRFR